MIEEKIKYLTEESLPERTRFAGSDFIETLYNGAPEFLSIERDTPRLIMTLNAHDKTKCEEALVLHPELYGKAYIQQNGLYVNGVVDLSALYNTWHNLPK